MMARALELHPDRLFPADPRAGAGAAPRRARGIDCGFLARLVTGHRLADREAADLAHDLASGLVRRACRIDDPLFAAQAA